MLLEDQVAVITGAGQGIGRAIALRLAGEGAAIVVADMNPESAAKVAGEIEALGRRAAVCVGNVTRKADVDAMARTALDRFGRLDIWVNNAGTTVVKPAEEISEEEWDHVVAVNLKGVFLGCQAAARAMLPRGRGTIINIASMMGTLGLPLRAPYTSTKAAVINLTRTLACEWGGRGIRVNAIGPGYVRTDFVQQYIDAGRIDVAGINRRTPMGRMAEPDEIARVALFLASDLASYMNGQTVFPDGGYTAYGGW